MPTYEYKCPNGHTFELFQRMSDEPVGICSECGEAGKRQISGGAGFIFKGDGFYITDHRSKDYQEKAKSETTGSSASESKGDGASKSGAASGSESSSDSSSKSSDSPSSKGSDSSSKSEGTSK